VYVRFRTRPGAARLLFPFWADRLVLVASALTLSASLVVSCGRESSTSDADQALRAEIRSCADSTTVVFESTAAAPDGVTEIWPLSRLWAYQYEPASPDAVGPVIDGGAFPAPSGIDLLDEEGSASALPSPPPTAQIPTEQAVETVRFTNLLVTAPGAVVIASSDLATLEGDVADTPLGPVEVESIRSHGRVASVDMRFSWDESLGDGTTFEPKGALLPSLQIDGREAVARDASYIVGNGTVQTLTFELPDRSPVGAARLTLDGFGILFSGTVTMGEIPGSC
jgi:hypothetical protein